MEKTFKLKKLSAFGYLIWPALFIVGIIWAFQGTQNTQRLPLGLRLIIAILIASTFVIPQAILFINYWIHSNKIILKVKGSEFIYLLENDSISFTSSEIESVQKTWSYSKIYGNFYYWTVKVKSNNLLLPCFIISAKEISTVFSNV